MTILRGGGNNDRQVANDYRWQWRSALLYGDRQKRAIDEIADRGQLYRLATVTLALGQVLLARNPDF